MRNRTRVARSPFVVTFAMAALASACGGNATNDGGNAGAGGGSGGSGGATGGSSGNGATGGGGTGGQPGCPIAPPELGTSCAEPELTCDYNFCKPPLWQSDIVVQCVGGKWADWGISSCNPPPPVCPPSQPANGEPCAQEGQSCSYGDGNCCPPTEAKCSGGQWQLLITTCNPPPPPPCPVDLPKHGSSCGTGDPCGSMSQFCQYDWCSAGGPAYDAQCDGSTWSVKKNCEPGPG